MNSSSAVGESDDEVDAPGDQVGDRLGAAAIGHVLERGVHGLGEEFAGKMLQRSVAGAAEQQRRRPRARHVDEVGECADGIIGIGHHHERILGEQADHREIVDGAVRQRFVKRRGDGVTGGNAHQRIAVGRHAGDLAGRDPAAGARPRIDDDLLTQTARQARRR